MNDAYNQFQRNWRKFHIVFSCVSYIDIANFHEVCGGTNSGEEWLVCTFQVTGRVLQLNTLCSSRLKVLLHRFRGTLKGNPLEYLEYANSLQKNLQFFIETPNSIGDLLFLDLNMNVNDERIINYHWYQKSTHTGIISKFRSCAQLHMWLKGLYIRFSMQPVIGNPLL